MPRRAVPRTPYRYFNSSPEIVRLVVTIYHRSGSSLRATQTLLADRGINVSYETVRHWSKRFGPSQSDEVGPPRTCEARDLTNEPWHLQQCLVKISGEMACLWQAVDRGGDILDVYVTKTKDDMAARSFIQAALQPRRAPEMITV